MDSLADIEDGKWLTLAELAEARGIDKLSAARLVRRHRWRRQKDNEQRVRALVPLKWIEGKEDSPRDNPADNPADLSHALKVLEASVASLTTARERAEARADTLQTRLDAAQVELSAAKI